MKKYIKIAVRINESVYRRIRHSHIVYSCRYLLLYVNEYCIFPSVECWILNIFSVKTC
jgi:hypothetical protein